MNIFDVMQYMTENGINGIKLSHSNDVTTIHQFLSNGKVLQTVTEQTIFSAKEKPKAKT